MKLKALVNFSYQNKSFKAGQEFAMEENEVAETLIKSGHVEAMGEQKAAVTKAK